MRSIIRTFLILILFLSLALSVLSGTDWGAEIIGDVTSDVLDNETETVETVESVRESHRNLKALLGD